MHSINQVVKFKVPGLNGPRRIAGRIVLILADGRLEVKAQLGGYYQIKPSEIIT